MEEDDDYLSLSLQSRHPVDLQEQLHEPPASGSAPQHLSDTYDHVTRPLPDKCQPKDIYSYELLRATIASQGQEHRNDATANHPVDVVKSSTEQSSVETEDSTSTPLSEAIRPTSSSPSNVAHHTIPTPRPLPPQPQLEFHGWSGQVLPLAAGSSMLPLHTIEGRSLYLRWYSNHVTDRPVVGKVYYIPDGRNFPTSVIHKQKQQEGFFKHPVLVIGVEDSFAYFYALTKAPPVAIREMSMCLRVSESTVDEGLYTLRLAYGSPRMQTETWMNLEQRFYIEVSSIYTDCTRDIH
jgi:hypothetical protein